METPQWMEKVPMLCRDKNCCQKTCSISLAQSIKTLFDQEDAESVSDIAAWYLRSRTRAFLPERSRK